MYLDFFVAVLDRRCQTGLSRPCNQLISIVGVPVLGMKSNKPKRESLAQNPTPSRAHKATTQEVVGSFETKAQIDPKWQHHYQNLIELREHLAAQKKDLVKDALEEQPVPSQHLADAATDSFDRDFALSIISSEQDALHEIDQALNRIREGNYGTCELTGKPIEAERLRAIPWTRFSAAAEQQLEKEGAVNRPHLGALTELPRPDTTSQTAEET